MEKQNYNKEHFEIIKMRLNQNINMLNKLITIETTNKFYFLFICDEFGSELKPDKSLSYMEYDSISPKPVSEIKKGDLVFYSIKKSKITKELQLRGEI